MAPGVMAMGYSTPHVYLATANGSDYSAETVPEERLASGIASACGNPAAVIKLSQPLKDAISNPANNFNARCMP